MSKNWKQSLETYSFTYTLPGTNTKVRFAPIKMKQLKSILLIESSEDPDEIDLALDKLIQSCIIEPEHFDVDNLYLQDRFALMIQLRIRSKGSTYEFQMTCPKCGSQSMQSIDLEALPSIQRPDEYNKIIKVNDDLSIVIDHITRKMQKEVEDYITRDNEIMSMNGESKRLQLKIAEKLLYGVAKSIRKVIFEGEEIDITFEDAIEIVDALTEDQFNEITKWFDDNTFGINFNAPIVCPHMMMKKEGKKKMQVPCGYTETYRLPVERFFG